MSRFSRTSWMTLLLGIAAAVLSGSAWPAEFITLEDECNGRQLMIQGVIDPGDYQRFVEELGRVVAKHDLPAVQDPDVLWTVKLDSAGGDLGEALRVGRLLRQVFATTEVGYRYAPRPDGVYDFARSGDIVCLDGRDRLSGCAQDIVEAECTGACLLIWLGGAERRANEGRLGLHGLSGAVAVDDYLAEMGVSDDWADRILALDPAGDGWLSWPERHALGGRAAQLDRLVAECPAPLSSEESFQSVTAPSDVVRDRLMDRADAHRACRRRHMAAARAETLVWLRDPV